ncbi:MAG: putative bifunctional diguanylate cyclase/phosphodiesterase [Woeseia sp.]
MSSHKVSKFRGPGSRRPRSAFGRQLDLICRSGEQIHQIKGVRNALSDVVNNCSKHLNLSVAILMLGDKGITLRSESGGEPLSNAGRLIQELDKRLAEWQAAANKRAVEGFDAFTDVSELEALVPCKCVATPVIVAEDSMEGVLLFARNPECPDFGKRERTLLRAIAANISSIVEARFDSLTGLVNRNEFEYLVEKSMNGGRSTAARHSILHLNLDELQSVDESLGRAARDEAIRQVGWLLAGELEDIGPVARIGEDEFSIFIADCSADRGWCIGEDIRRAISDLSIMWAGRPIKLTTSIGVSQLSAESETIESALAAANIACVVAKDRGRDRVAIYRHTDALMLHGRERMQSVESVQQALRNDEFLLYSQLIKPLTTATKTPHFEILLRGIGDQGNPLAPEEFMPHAERSRLMPAVDRWVITHTLEKLADFGSQLAKEKGFFAINLSGQSICDNSFLDFVIGELVRTGVPMTAICFEVTESTAILNMKRAKQFMTVLREKGCRFSLDDFGSGLSSFSYLKTLPIDFLKIDGQFVREIAQDPVSNAMVAAINQMSHAMGLKTIAEYVENKAIETQVTSLGVDYGQGFGIEKPTLLADQLASSSQGIKHIREAQRG